MWIEHYSLCSYKIIFIFLENKKFIKEIRTIIDKISIVITIPLILIDHERFCVWTEKTQLLKFSSQQSLSSRYGLNKILEILTMFKITSNFLYFTRTEWWRVLTFVRRHHARVCSSSASNGTCKAVWRGWSVD